MQFVYQLSNVVEFSGTADNPSCKVLDCLELKEISVHCIGPDGRAKKNNLLNTRVLIIVVKVDLSNTA